MMPPDPKESRRTAGIVYPQGMDGDWESGENEPHISNIESFLEQE